MLYLSSSLVKTRLAYATGLHMESCFWSRHAASPFYLRRFFSCFFCSIEIFVKLVICFLLSSNAMVCSSFSSSLFWFFVLFLDSSVRRGSDSSPNLGVNFIRWCMQPMNDLSCLSVFCGSSVFIDSHFF